MSRDQVAALSQQLVTQQSLIRAFDRYYAGEQQLTFLHPQVRAATQGRLQNLVVNWPRVVVDAVEERLDVEGFRLAGEEAPLEELQRIWQANDLDEWSGLGHVDALVHGRSFALVWASEDPTTPRITVETAREMTVTYWPGTNRVASACKRWSGLDGEYATLYLPDRVERYGAQSSGTVGGSVTAAAWDLIEVIPHDLGLVPVVPFLNNPRIGVGAGESELSDVIPLADAINKLGTDMMVASEYHAMPRRWATGLSLEGGEAGAERLRETAWQKWSHAEAGRFLIAPDEQVRFGQFTEATLDNFVNAIKLLTEQVAAIAGLPPHMLGVNTANPASADAIRSAESKLVQKVKRKQRGFGGSWERVMRLAQLVRDGVADPDLVRLETIWRDPETRTVAQQMDAAVKGVQAQIVTKRQAREDLGYTPVQIERMEQDDASSALGAVRFQLDEAQRLQREQGLSQQAAFAAVGLLQAASAMNTTTP
jgi:hypothetical protein